MIDLLGGCSINIPSRDAWIMAIATHVGLTMMALPVGVALYKRPSLAAPAAVLMGATPILMLHFLQIPWMVAFLASTFGFQYFFKSIIVAQKLYPEGADQSQHFFILWFTSLPEPVFAKGKPASAPAGELLRRIKLMVGKAFGISLFLTLFQNASVYPFGVPDSKLATLWKPLLNGYVHLWFLYFFAAFCFDFGAMMTTATGHLSEDGFCNPLVESSTIRELWGEKWNLPVQRLLQRAVYIPARKRNVFKLYAVLLTFLASGLLHEYNFYIHNHGYHKTGYAILFFALMGLLMVAEERFAESLTWLRTLPRPVVSIKLALMACIPFELLFFRSWLEAGVIETANTLFPYLKC